MSEALERLVAEHAGVAFEAQRNLLSLLGGDVPWELDIPAAQVQLGNHTFRCGLLGTESDQTATWLWAWANHGSTLPPALLTLAETARDPGLRSGAPEFVDGEQPLGGFDTLKVTVACCGIVGASGWWIGRHTAGSAVVLIDEPDLRRPVTALDVVGVLTAAASTLAVDHRAMTLAYLRRRGTVTVDGPLAVHAEVGGVVVRATFDDRSRLVGVETSM